MINRVAVKKEGLFGRHLAIYLMSQMDGKVVVAHGVRLDEVTPDGAMPLPTTTLELTEAQALMDELWHVGLRPSEGSGSAGALAATQKHLEDMRALVFEKGGPR